MNGEGSLSDSGDIVCFLRIKVNGLPGAKGEMRQEAISRRSGIYPYTGRRRDAKGATDLLAFLPDQDPAYARKLDIGKHTPPGYWEPHGDGRDS